MKRLFIASSGNPDRLATMFRAELPDFEVMSDVAALDGEPVPYAVVGRPHAGVLSAIPGLELVLSLNAGVEHLLSNTEIPHSVPIVRLVDPDLAAGMSEWVVGRVLAWHRNFAFYRDKQAKGEWAPQREKLAHERTVTVLGAGALGSAVAGHLVALGFSTRVWSRSGRSVAGAKAYAGHEDLQAALSNADVLVDLLPLTPETENLLDAKVFSALAPGAFLVNVARGGHVVDSDLIAALDSGHLSAAALDVFRTEPLPADHAFWTHDKIMVTPHVSAPTHPQTAVAEMVKSIRLHQENKPIPNVVDRKKGY